MQRSRHSQSAGVQGNQGEVQRGTLHENTGLLLPLEKDSFRSQPQGAQ